MNVISRLTLEDFWKSHNQAKKSLMAWYNKATKEVWEIPKDIEDSDYTSKIINNKVAKDIYDKAYEFVTIVSKKV